MSEKEQQPSRLHAIVEGRVQGVSFRYFVEREALKLGIHGWVRNRWEGTVEVLAEGDRQSLEKFLAALQRGSRSSFVTRVNPKWEAGTSEFNHFQIRQTI